VPLASAKNEKTDVAWTYTDTALRYAYAWIQPSVATGNLADPSLQDVITANASLPKPVKWKMRTAVGGGPVVLEAGAVKVYNKEERMFVTGLQDKHPRTAMGYTRDGRLIILAVEGRNPGIAEGATLEQLGHMLLQAGCVEGLNLDGGGSSCLLINGKTTIKPSDKEGQRPVPAVFVVTTTSY
jgi:Exopolysaccharide biosynthesis protein related to N-acetylglucosamine-1-phosphodiester alpha-N-acetylglucosaminidase